MSVKLSAIKMGLCVVIWLSVINEQQALTWKKDFRERERKNTQSVVLSIDVLIKDKHLKHDWLWYIF